MVNTYICKETYKVRTSRRLCNSLSLCLYHSRSILSALAGRVSRETTSPRCLHKPIQIITHCILIPQLRSKTLHNVHQLKAITILQVFIILCPSNPVPMQWKNSCTSRGSCVYSSSSVKTSSPRFRRAMRSFFFFRASDEVSFLAFLLPSILLPIASNLSSSSSFLSVSRGPAPCPWIQLCPEGVILPLITLQTWKLNS